MKFIGIIPARYASTRFPGKPLAMIQGTTMIQRVYQQALQCAQLQDVVVATDDQRIFDHVKRFGKVVMTSPHHLSGTDRCLEAFSLLDTDQFYGEDCVVINIQGDEPYIQPEQISLLADAFQVETQIATLAKPIESSQELLNENVVKVVINNQGQAMYFSRLPIPFCKNTPREQWPSKAKYYKHLGLYAYTIKALRAITGLGAGQYEMAESLEQLRWLENGFPIKVLLTLQEGFAIDTPEDLIRLNIIKKQ